MAVARSIIFAVLVLAATTAPQNAPSHLARCGSQTAVSRQKDVSNAMAFFEKLRGALAKNDPEAVANLVNFPLRVNGKYRVANRKAFLAAYDRIFDTKVRAAIQKQPTECIFGNWQGFMAGNGDVWFDYSENDPAFKVIAVNNESWRSRAKR